MPKLSDITEASVNLANDKMTASGGRSFFASMALDVPKPTFSSAGVGSTTRRPSSDGAYGYEHPMEGHLRSSQFSGGESRVEVL